MPNAKKLPSGNWRVQVYAGKDADGKKIVKSFTADTKREAEYLAADFLQNHKEKIKSGMTVDEALTAYIDIKRKVLSPSTVLNYKAYQKNHFQQIAKVLINDLSTADIQKFINTEAAQYGGKTVANVWGLLSAALKVYRPDFSPAVALPRKSKSEIKIPTQDDLILYYNAVKGTKLEIPFLLASQVGLRASEAAAVRKSDIEGNTLYVRRARVRDEFGVIVEKEPKTDAGYRALPITDTLRDLLLSSESERVSPLDADQIPSRWSLMIKRNNLTPCGYHALRHYYASRAALSGIPKMYLVELMGHSSSKMLDQVYLHTFPDEKAQFAALIANNSQLFFDKISHEISRNAE